MTQYLRLYEKLSEISSKLLHSQTIIARDLKFWGNVHLLPQVMCHMSCVTCSVKCHLSHVMCHMSCVPLWKWTWWSQSVEGLLSMGPTLSSLYALTYKNNNFKKSRIRPTINPHVCVWHIAKNGQYGQKRLKTVLKKSNIVKKGWNAKNVHYGAEMCVMVPQLCVMVPRDSVYLEKFSTNINQPATFLWFFMWKRHIG